MHVFGVLEQKPIRRNCVCCKLAEAFSLMVNNKIEGNSMVLVDWFPDDKTVIGCWVTGYTSDGTPTYDHSHCGTLCNFWPPCSSVSLNHLEARRENAQASDEADYWHPLDYWTPRGKIITRLPPGYPNTSIEGYVL